MFLSNLDVPHHLHLSEDLSMPRKAKITTPTERYFTQKSSNGDVGKGIRLGARFLPADGEYKKFIGDYTNGRVDIFMEEPLDMDTLRQLAGKDRTAKGVAEAVFKAFFLGSVSFQRRRVHSMLSMGPLHALALYNALGAAIKDAGIVIENEEDMSSSAP